MDVVNQESREPTTMPTPSESHQEDSGTYVVPERFSDEELSRLLIQDEMFTSSIGGVLPEQPDPARFQRVLDIGCGPGAWLFNMARTYPTLSSLIGVDINAKMLGYARTQAVALQVDDRVEFRQMDALRQLEFPNESFDLVNERLAIGWRRSWDWPTFLQECQRITRPGGVIRITELNVAAESNSSALIQLCNLAIEGFHQAGYIFTPESDGLTKEIAHLMRQYGVQDVQTHVYVLEYRAGTREGQLFAENFQHLFREMEPFLRKWTRIPDNYEDIYQQMLHEMQLPDFVVVPRLVTVWGTRSPVSGSISMN